MTHTPRFTSIRNRLTVALFILVAISILIFSHMESRPSLLVLAGVAIAASWLLVEGPRGKPVPSLLLNVVVLAAGLFFWYEMAREAGQNLVVALGHFMIVLILCKLFEQKTTRDITQIIILAFLLVVASAMMFASSIAFAVYLVAFMLHLIYTIFLFNLHDTSEKWSTQTHAALASPHPAQSARLGQDLRRMTWQSALLLFPLALTIFVSIPRARSGFLNSLGAGAVLQTGYSDLVQFHIGEMTESEEVVMTVKLTRRTSFNTIENVGSEILQPYFRGQALDAYDVNQHQWFMGSDLVGGVAERKIERRLVSIMRIPEQYGESNVIEQEYLVYDTHGDTVIFTMAPNAPIYAYLYEDQRANMVRFNSQDFSMRLSSSPTKSFHYRVGSLAASDPSLFTGRPFVTPGDMGGQGTPAQSTAATPASPASPPAPSAPVASPRQPPPSVAPPSQPVASLAEGPSTQPAPTTQPRSSRFRPRKILEIPEEITTLARRIALDLLPDSKSPPPPENVQAIAMRFESYLRVTYPYSLNSQPVDKDIDPSVDFLLHRQKIGGNCQYFASAMVMLCRSVGINSRVVSGYVGSEFNNVSLEYVIRMKDAHLWAEYYVPQFGWVLSDPSPSRVATAKSTWPISRWAQDVIEAVENLWLSSVVSFDNESRTAIINSIKAFIVQFEESFANELLAIELALTGGAGIWQGVSILLCMICFPLLAWWFVRRFRQDGHLLLMPAMAARRSGKMSSEFSFMDELFSLVAPHGTVRRSDQTPREFAQDHAARFGNHLDDAQWLVDTYYGLRFGMTKADAKLRTQIATVIRRIKDGLKHPPSIAQRPNS